MPSVADLATVPRGSGFKDATRVLTSALAPLEKRCLIWMAARMPARVNSDHLTGLALAAMAGCGASFALARYSRVGLVLAVVCLALNWFGDSLDGTLARVRQHQRPRYGFYVDHVVDAVGAALLFAGLAWSGYMSPLVACGLLIAYFLLCIEVFLATHTLGTFTMSYFKMGPTELRILLSVGSLVLCVKPEVAMAGHTWLLFDVGGVVGAVGLLGTMAYATACHTAALYRAEPLPCAPRNF